MKLDPDRVPQGLGYANHHFIPVIVLCRSSLMHSSSIAQTDSVWQKGFSHKNNCVGTMCIIALGGGYHIPGLGRGGREGQTTLSWHSLLTVWYSRLPCLELLTGPKKKK